MSSFQGQPRYNRSCRNGPLTDLSINDALKMHWLETVLSRHALSPSSRAANVESCFFEWREFNLDVDDQREANKLEMDGLELRALLAATLPCNKLNTESRN